MSAEPKSPSEFHPDLSADRLALIEATIRAARSEALEVLKGYRWLPWSIGCFAYDLTKHAFKSLGDREHWLTFIGHGNAYILKVGDVVIRVQREDRPIKTVIDAEKALLEQPCCQVVMNFDGMPLKLSECLVRLEFETNGGALESCSLRVWSNGESEKNRVLYHQWPIATDAYEKVASLPRREAEEVLPAEFEIGDESAHESDVG